MAAAQLSLTGLGVRKSLTCERKNQAADSFGAKGEFLSAGKKAARDLPPGVQGGDRHQRAGLELLKKTRKKEIKALFRTWDCILNCDQAGFEQGLIDSVTLWERERHDGEPAFPRYCITEEATALQATGRLLGLEAPRFDPPIAARLLTPESIGISIPQ
jgi:hypothetical protein